MSTTKKMTRAEARKLETFKRTIVRVYNEKYFPRHQGRPGTSSEKLFNNPELRGEFIGMLPKRYRDRDIMQIASILQGARKQGLLRARARQTATC